MALPANSIPIRWPSGPLELARREKAGSLTGEGRTALERWHDPGALDILKGTPVNCLVLSWAAGLPQDAAQQRSAAPLVEAARKRGMSVIGWVEGPASHDSAIAAGRTAGLTAVAAEGFKGRSDFPVIPCGGRASAPWDSSAAVLPVTENVWPGVSAAPTGGDVAVAGPTGLPWLDSNGWYIQMARARTEAGIWVMFDSPKDRLLQPADYARAVCDAEAAGGRWVISLDDRLRAGLLERSGAALKTWEAITAALVFFENHLDWRNYRSLGLVGVISDFSGGNFDMSGEILNLMARRNLLMRPIWTHKTTTASFNGLKALVYADSAPPPQDLRKRMVAFVEQGGLLVTGPVWGAAGSQRADGSHPRFDVRALGKGRLAVAKEDPADPYQVALDTQILLSHAHDLVKFYNSGSTGGTHYTTSPDGKKALLQVLSYGGSRASGLMTVWIRDKYRAARLWRVGAAGPVPVEQAPAEDYTGTELQMPAVPAQGYSALEFDV